MAAFPQQNIQLDIERETIAKAIFIAGMPWTDFATKEQKKEDGVPMWEVEALLIFARPGSSPDKFRIRVPMNVKQETMKNLVGENVVFDGLRVNLGMNDGKPYMSFRADGIGMAKKATPKA